MHFFGSEQLDRHLFIGLRSALQALWTLPLHVLIWQEGGGFTQPEGGQDGANAGIVTHQRNGHDLPFVAGQSCHPWMLSIGFDRAEEAVRVHAQRPGPAKIALPCDHCHVLSRNMPVAESPLAYLAVAKRT